MSIEHVNEDCQCEGRWCPRCGEKKCCGMYYQVKGIIKTPCKKCKSEYTTRHRHQQSTDYIRQDVPKFQNRKPGAPHGPRANIKTRILTGIEIQPDGCWYWMRRRNKNGYGTINIKGMPERAHRLSYEVFKGEIPEGLHIDHLCHVRHCVNPDHLEPVTNQENIRRGAEYRRKMKTEMITWEHLYRDLYEQVYGEQEDQAWLKDAKRRREKLRAEDTQPHKAAERKEP